MKTWKISGAIRRVILGQAIVSLVACNATKSNVEEVLQWAKDSGAEVRSSLKPD